MQVVLLEPSKSCILNFVYKHSAASYNTCVFFYTETCRCAIRNKSTTSFCIRQVKLVTILCWWIFI